MSVAVGSLPAGAIEQGDRCSRRDQGSVRLATNGASMVCASGPFGLRWGPGVYAPDLGSLPTANPTETDTAGSGRRSTLRRSGGPAAGRRCLRSGEQALDAVGGLLRCEAGRWNAIATGPQSPLPPITGPELLPLPENPAAGSTFDPLDPNLGYPNGLPYDVQLPPTARLLPFNPTVLPSLDYFKKARWRNEAFIPGTDLEAVNAWFVGECERIDWLHDPNRVERFPSNAVNKYYDTDVQMVLGECRTKAGSATDPTRKRPWFLAWGVSLQPGADQLELVVELRAFPRAGGRSG
jgi:hypothetical protein